jgi:hypothetical protein
LKLLQFAKVHYGSPSTSFTAEHCGTTWICVHCTKHLASKGGRPALIAVSFFPVTLHR